ncbi:hypothetical protein FE257_005577 [Aspergillus nanangensis]|uniref:RING-type E3 ubiquitin transferase n=1 Tax=Aspergillus nanangensis TaxID=2582783 RepID=A0AAD4GVE8_ASPNN|nr:hypothetical protein FE257_005577 [Aspergillus nanangensis]
MADAGDRVFCHACGGMWRQSDHGLVCPHCQSDFTEIIEIPPDPEEDVPDPPTSVPGERPDSPANPWANHNPWANQNDDPDPWDPGNGYRHHSYRSPDGRFSFSTTTYTHGFTPSQSPRSQRERPMDPMMPMVRGLDTIFHGLAGTYQQAGQGQQMGNRIRTQQQQQQSTGDGPTSPRAGPTPHVWQGSFNLNMGGGGGMQSEYHTTGGLNPRDTDGPQPMGTPLRTLGDILQLFREVGVDGNPGGAERPMDGPNPMALLSTLLNLRHGDAVYSQEELDRVISQLVDQNVNRTAPPPANQVAIESLPKVCIDKEMLGSEGRAECSICMDPVELGTEVTELPCKHWFHPQCIEMWLNQHNTCPHCRRGIDAPAQRGDSSNDPMVIDDSPPTSRRTSAAAAHGHSGPSRSRQSSWTTDPGERSSGEDARKKRREYCLASGYISRAHEEADSIRGKDNRLDETKKLQRQIVTLYTEIGALIPDAKHKEYRGLRYQILTMAGYLKRAMIYDVRRFLGKKIEFRYGSASVSQIYGHRSEGTYPTHYQAHCSSIDTVGDVLDEEEETYYIEYFQGYGQFREVGLPQELPAEFEEAILQREELSNLRAHIVRCEKGESAEIINFYKNEYRKVMTSIRQSELHRYQTQWKPESKPAVKRKRGASAQPKRVRANSEEAILKKIKFRYYQPLLLYQPVAVEPHSPTAVNLPSHNTTQVGFVNQQHAEFDHTARVHVRVHSHSESSMGDISTETSPLSSARTTPDLDLIDSRLLEPAVSGEDGVTLANKVPGITHDRPSPSNDDEDTGHDDKTVT